MGKGDLSPAVASAAPGAHNRRKRAIRSLQPAREIAEEVMMASLVASASVLTLLGASPAVPPVPSAAGPPPFVVRISIDLVQVDAVVTDKKGRLVTDLRLEDFEIVEDGRKQPLTNVSYVAVAALRAGSVDRRDSGLDEP